MTNSDIHSILNGIQAAKEAFDRLPEIERQLQSAQAEIMRLHQQVVTREETILAKGAEIDTLKAKVREVTDQRDDASFRQLEEADRVAALGKSLRAILAEGEAVLAQVDSGFVRRTALEEQVKTLTEERNEEQRKANALQGDIDGTMTHFRSLSADYDRLKDELAEVKRTWREPDPVKPVEQFMGHDPAPLYRSEGAPEVAQADPTPTVAPSTESASSGGSTALPQTNEANPSPQVEPVKAEEKPWWEREAEQAKKDNIPF